MLDIYLMQISGDIEIGAVYPPERQRTIDSANNPTVKRERYAVWRLFEHGVKRSLNKRLDEISPYLNEHGKWISDSCFFSLTHTACAVAVAISDKPVGIDIETVREIDVKAFSKRFLTDREYLEVMQSDCKRDALIALWTKKESVYKMLGIPPFNPSKIETSEYRVFTYSEQFEGGCIYLSVCSEGTEKSEVIAVSFDGI